MYLIWFALALLIAGSFLPFLLKSRASLVGMISTLIACVVGIIVPVQVLLTGKTIEIGICAIDPLSAFFLTLLFIVAFGIAIFGHEYMAKYNERVSFALLNMLIASMLLVLIARNGILFLISWEISATASFFLVTFEDEKKSVRKAGLIYLIAANIGSAFLIPLFILLDQGNNLNFNQFGITNPLVLLLAFFGFGIKAGFFPLHVWLPEAHPAAPSHISALMSGVMIKLGIYGILRTLTFIDSPPIWFGFLLIITGIISGIIAIIFALLQNDLKRLLAYSSVENMGIITLALGIGLIGMGLKNPTLITLGLIGSLLHIMNHSLFKSLLFMGSGAIYHATGTKELNSLGGLIKLMPKTAFCFFIAILAITAVPPLNGFFSEFFIYLAAFKGMMAGSFLCLLSIISLATIGGLAIVCFSALFGSLFSGTPKVEAKEVGLRMRFSLFFMAIACLSIPWLLPFIIKVLNPIVLQIGKVETLTLEETSKSLYYIMSFSLLFLLIIGITTLKKAKKQVETWACGFSAPTVRMQYTFSSFVQPITSSLKIFLKEHFLLKKIFPQKSSFSMKSHDVTYYFIYLPFFKKLRSFSLKLRWLQHGNLNIYILYIFLTLLFLLAYKLR